MTEPGFHLNIYVHFVMFAVYGRLSEADSLMRSMPGSIRIVADFLARTYPIDAKPLYRGMLLDPKIGLRRDLGFKFASWSEDRDVARWFAMPEATISDVVREHHPDARGFVAALPGPASQVLFHYSWAKQFGDFVEYALRHPQVAYEGMRQIKWSLSTQREVITEPIDILAITPIESVDGAALVDLERRLLPPWECTVRGQGIAL